MPTGIYTRPLVIKGTFTKGHIPWHKGKTKVYSKETLEVMTKRKLENPTTYWKGKKRGKIHSEEWKKAQSVRSALRKHSEETKLKLSLDRRGSNNPAWKGGVTKLIEKIRGLPKYSQWRLGVYERDKFTCKICQDDIGGNLEAHHIKPLSFLIGKYDIKNTEEANLCEELWIINNGQTLCKQCHKQTDTYMVKAKHYNEK